MSLRQLTAAVPWWFHSSSRLLPQRYLSSVTGAAVQSRPSTDWGVSTPAVAEQGLDRRSASGQHCILTAAAHHRHFSNSIHQQASHTTTASGNTDTPPSVTGKSSSDSSSSSSDSSSSSSDSSSDGSGPEFDSVDTIHTAVLDAALQFIHEYGLTEEAIAQGAESLGYSRMTHGVVTGGGAELFVHLQERLNDKLEQHLQQQQFSNASFATVVEAGVRARLELLLPYSAVWPRGLALVALSPTYLQRHLHVLAVLADHVAHYAGDISTDSRWYLKRAAVLAVYKASELCLLQDESPDHQDTWRFLQRRCSELQSGCSLTNSLDTTVADAAQLSKAALHTGMNMLGLNKRF